MSTNKTLRTPLIKPRPTGGTFYTFSSALEDIGININDSTNKIVLSHYALLDIPSFNDNMNTLATTKYDVTNPGDYIFAEGFQNYVLNLETIIRNQDTYNYAASRTISERVFWKWLGKSCMKFVKDDKDPNYYVDENKVVKCIGTISSSAQRSDDYGIHNETFVQIPSSFGQTKILFKKVEDSNYKTSDGITGTNRDGFLENFTKDDYDTSGYLPTGLSARALYDYQTDMSYAISDKECMCIELSIANLRKYYGSTSISFDDIAIKDDYVLSSSFPFNAILVYYTIYDSTGTTALATNAYGILLLNSSEKVGEGDTPTYKFPSLVKSKSTADTTGTSYSFRINIKTTSIYNGDIAITDNSTSAFTMATDFNDVIKNLATAVSILHSNANLIASINTDNTNIKGLAAQALDKVDSIEKAITELKTGTVDNAKITYLEAESAELTNIVGDVNFMRRLYDTLDGESVGNISADTFTFNNITADKKIKASDLEVVNANIQNVISQSDAFTVKNNSSTTLAKIDTSGIYSSSSLFFPNSEVSDKTIDEDVLNTVFTAIQVTYPEDNVGNYKISIKDAHFEDDYTETIYKSLKSGNYVDLVNLLALLIAKVKKIDGIVWNSLDS